MQLYNTKTKQKEEFEPQNPPEVTLYTCGPTVYHFAHIGNLRAYVYVDILKKTLEHNNYSVKSVVNITDVGHLTEENIDQGEDRMEKGARREGLTVWDVAKKYTEAFMVDMKKLNVTPPSIWSKATDYIEEQIALVKTLEEKGYTYSISDGIYFDTSRFSTYADFAKLDVDGLQEGARVEKNTEKKNPTDFALWKFSPETEQRAMEWESPWGKGFPGWHVECSAMAMHHLGETIDIHTGGIDHVPVHHTNEIAQSEAATGKEFAKFWLHNEHVDISGAKMAKSDNNFLTLQSLEDRGYDPLAYRYLLMLTHYRKKIDFTWDALDAASNALKHLRSKANALGDVSADQGALPYEQEFFAALEDDLNTPRAIAAMWDMLDDDSYDNPQKRKSLEHFDNVLNVDIFKSDLVTDIPADIEQLLKQREIARKSKDWQTSDRIRDELANRGFNVEDTATGQILKKL